MAGKKSRSGSYFIADRLIYLMNTNSFRLNDYLMKFEISKHTAYLDREHLRNFYDIDFVYNKTSHLYERG